MPVEDIHKIAESKMKKSIEVLKHEMATIRTGRASPALLDRVSVDYFGSPTPVNALATVSAPEPRMLTIQPWDRQSLSAIEKAIQKSDLGLNPTNDGTMIRLVIPQLNDERRKELVRLVHHRLEESRVAIRNCRRDATLADPAVGVLAVHRRRRDVQGAVAERHPGPGVDRHIWRRGRRRLRGIRHALGAGPAQPVLEGLVELDAVRVRGGGGAAHGSMRGPGICVRREGPHG